MLDTSLPNGCDARSDGTISTVTGGTIAALVPAPDDDEIVTDPCVWCDGLGYGGDAVGLSGDCDACQGSGSSGKTTRGELRRKQWESEVFYIDATRAELMDRDICPDCGSGGCGGECHFTADEWAEIMGSPIEAPY